MHEDYLVREEVRKPKKLKDVVNGGFPTKKNTPAGEDEKIEKPPASIMGGKRG